MKTEVKKHAKEFGCEALYSGKERTMYIHGAHEKICVISIQWNINPLFNVVAGNHIYRQ